MTLTALDTLKLMRINHIEYLTHAVFAFTDFPGEIVFNTNQEFHLFTPSNVISYAFIIAAFTIIIKYCLFIILFSPNDPFLPPNLPKPLCFIKPPKKQEYITLL
jgi:hypothetical protein